MKDVDKNTNFERLRKTARSVFINIILGEPSKEKM